MTDTMTQTLFLHIGLHKTGSTAIQNFCTLNRPAFAAQGFCYPASSVKWNGHHPYAWSLGLRHPHRDEADGDAPTLAERMLKEASGRHLILSSEDFEFLGPLQMKQLLEHFTGLDCRVLVYLRPQDSYLESEYAQHVRMDETRFSGDIRDFYMSFDFMQRYNYLQLLRPWENHFGKPNLIVRPYQSSRFRDGDLFRDFCDAIGIVWKDSFMVPGRDESNVSLSADALRALREINKLPLDSSDRSVIVDILQRQGSGSTRILDDQSRRSFKGIFSKTNDRIADKYIKGQQQLFDDD